ncbi:phage portal protein [Notoacmeibacter marinus]|uniref:phage portal protein n=1 Tax=Notoacmeibacter marinus TaxID=1876515 RepID=UPI000DF2C01F
MAWNWLRGAPTAGPAELSKSPAERLESKAGFIGEGFVALQLAGRASWTPRDYASLARHGYLGNAIVHAAVRLIAQTAAAVPWLLYESATEHSEHPLLSLLDRPNAKQAGVTFLEALYGQLLLSGNAYVERLSGASAVAELHLLRPDRVAVVADEDGWPVALEHRGAKGAARRIALAEDAGPEGGAAALHLALFHPLDDHYGLAPLQAALSALDIHNAASRWNKALLDNAARPSGALVYAPKEGGNLSDEQFERLKTELEDGYSGPSRAGRPLLLEGGLDWKAMGLTPQEMDFVEARNGAARDIALAFGVPPMLLGIPGDNTYANYKEANRAFYRLTILPLVTRIATELSAWLTPAFGPDLRLWFDADAVEGLSGERDALWQRIGQADFLTDDEKREAVGYQPLPAMEQR